MRKVFAWLGAATLFMVMSRAEAANDVLKPYVVLILDTSGSMAAATGSGPTSCGKRDTRLNHAVCAINNIVNSYGEMVFSLGRFRESTGGQAGTVTCDSNGDQEGNPSGNVAAPANGDVCTTQGPYCGDCDPSTGTTRSCAIQADCASSCINIVGESGGNCGDGLDNDNDGRIDDGCPVAPMGGSGETGLQCFDNVDSDGDGVINDGCAPQGTCTVNPLFNCRPANSDSSFEVLTPLVDGNNVDAARFTDGKCNVCSVTAGMDPEIWGVSAKTYTPLSSSLRGAQRYWEGNQAQDGTGTTIWAAANPGFDPINRDPAAAVFLSKNDSASCNPNPGTCAQFVGEASCGDNVDNDNDGRINDGCAPAGGNGQAETQCDDRETGVQCAIGNVADEDGDGLVNDGCPAIQNAESGAACAPGNTMDEDGDGLVNDGCPVVGNDNDGDGVVNDGCPAWCGGPNCCCQTQCRPYITILLTDGDETCTTFSNTLASATDLKQVSPRNDQIAINTIVRTGGQVNVTTFVTHAFKAGDQITITGTGVTAYTGGVTQGIFTVLANPAPGATTLSYADARTDAAMVTNGTASTMVAAIRHTAGLYTYDIQLKPIGFGIPAGTQTIEDIAHAGGAADIPGVNEGFYAQDEADLELAISQILADSVRAEACNEKDDDCDTRIDEDFPTKGATCSAGVGECLRTGTLVCLPSGQLGCNAVPGPVGTEVCNLKDDDCDGLIDEPPLSCNVCVPTGAEICDGNDNNCDGVADRTCTCIGGPNAGQTCRPANGTATNPDCPGGACPAASACTEITRSCGIGVCSGVEKCTFAPQCNPAPGCTQNCCFTGCDAVQDEPVETKCDGIDNDCDGICDGFTRDCSEQLGACDPNVPSSCPANNSLGSPLNPQNMVANAPETNCGLDTVDDDKDGFVNDGCLPNGPAETGAACANATDDDGDNEVNDGCPVPTLPIAQNVCRPGSRNCPNKANCQPGNQYSACSGETLKCNTPNCDVCNGLDDDCDNKIDEDFVGADCSTNCGIGTTVCSNGNIVCNSSAAGTDPTCNNVDDDCDGDFDEEWQPPGSTCGTEALSCDRSPSCTSNLYADNCCKRTQQQDGTFSCGGVPKCDMGSVICDGVPIATDICNCIDDDCDGQVDEDPDPNDPNNNICPGGASCVSCQCAFGCADGEFPCPLGKKCEGTAPNNYCVNDPCFQVNCPPVNGHAQTCIQDPQFANQHQCVDTCSLVNNTDQMDGFPSCSPTFVCVEGTGVCLPDNCTTFPNYCTANQSCVAGICVTNPCQGVTCDEDKYCLGGNCVASCADVTCAAGQRCRQGACETDPCGHPCPFGQTCNDTTGKCIEDPCKFRECPQGQWCNPNANTCEDDPCVTSNITCPNAGEVCRGGTCYDVETLQPDARDEHVTVGGGGGCNTTGGGNGLLLAFGLLGLFASRRRRTVGGAL